MAIAVAIISGNSVTRASVAKDEIENALRQQIPICNRFFHDIDKRDRADEGGATVAEPDLVGMSGQPDVDRKDPELLQELQDTLLSAKRNADDQHVDTRKTRELNQER